MSYAEAYSFVNGQFSTDGQWEIIVANDEIEVHVTYNRYVIRYRNWTHGKKFGKPPALNSFLRGL